jgi:hypothetical protein
MIQTLEAPETFPSARSTVRVSQLKGVNQYIVEALGGQYTFTKEADAERFASEIRQAQAVMKVPANRSARPGWQALSQAV